MDMRSYHNLVGGAQYNWKSELQWNHTLGGQRQDYLQLAGVKPTVYYSRDYVIQWPTFPEVSNNNRVCG